MKKSLFHIYDTLALNRLVTLTALIISALISGVSLWFNYKTQRDIRDKSYVIDPSGQVIPIKLSANRDQYEVEIKSHIHTFIELFYGLEPATLQSNLSKALWLADKSVDDLYKQKKMDGLYNRILQYALIQRIGEVHIQLDLEHRPASFYALVNFAVSRGVSVDHYQLEIGGNIQGVQRDFPNNPHGLLITNFHEQSLKKVKHEVVQK